jgi:mRNA interferase RelE/StbE
VRVYKLQYARSAEKELDKLPRSAVMRIREAIEGLAKDPHPRGSKKLQGEEQTYRVRVGDYRVIYEVHEKEVVILVIRVRHRKDAY